MAIPFNFDLFKKCLYLFLEKMEDLGGASKLYEYPYSGTTHCLAR